MPKTKDGGLNPKQIAFIAHYLTCFNSSEAARRAGYSKKTAYAIGYENLRKPQIKAEIDKRIAATAMSADEVLARLSDMARANLDDVITGDDEFSLELARGQGKLHLIKSLKRREFTDKDGNTTRLTEIELHDAQAALVHLGKHYKLFTSVIDIHDWREAAAAQGIPAAAIEAATEQATTLFEKIATGQAAAVVGEDKRDADSN